MVPDPASEHDFRDRSATRPLDASAPPNFDAIDIGYQDLHGAGNSFLLDSGDGLVLVEAGPQACLSTLERGLRDRGIDPADIAHCFVTHIHLDHAGAAGSFAVYGATIHAHPLGAPHLVDPAKLISSSRRVHGELYERWYGDPVAAPASRVHAVADGERITVGELVFQAIETPGHAKHHHAWHVKFAETGSRADGRAGFGANAGASAAASQGLLFTGDAAATFVPGSRFIGIPTPPPEYDLDAWKRSISRMREANATRLVLTHGGAVDSPRTHLDAMSARLLDEDAWLRRALTETSDDAEVLRRYRPWLHRQSDAAGVPSASRDVFIGDAWMLMNIMGVRRAMSRPAR